MNAARVKIAEERLHKCDEIFVVTDIARAVTNKSVEDVLIRQLGKGFHNVKRSQGVNNVCTKSEVGLTLQDRFTTDI